MKGEYTAIGLFGMLVVCGAFSPAANPPSLTHASMDVGNIISIVIPENPDENINVDQLTGEFRQQLERIKKQSRASKVEHGLVTLKRVLPEMSREEKRKTLPLIRRVLHGRRVSSNPGTMKNWTRDSQVEQMREGSQYVRSRSAGNTEERQQHRDYEEIGVREGASMGVEQIALDKEEHHGINPERAYSNRHQDFARRDDIREERIQYPEEDQQSKIIRSGQDWSAHWGDQYRGPDLSLVQPSTVDCNHKSDRTVRQKNPINEIIQNDRYAKPSRLPEIASSVSEENADCNKLNQRPGQYSPVSQSENADNSKRNMNDVRGYETADIATYVNYPRDFDINAAIKLICDKKNDTIQCLKDFEKNRGDLSPDKFPRRQEPINFEPEDYRSLQKPVLGQDRKQTDRSNVSGLENIVNEGIDDYISKKKRGQTYPEELKGLSAINPPIDRWNRPIYNRPASNSSNDPKDSLNVYELYSEKIVTPGLAYSQSDQANFKRNLNFPHKLIASRIEPNYRAEGLPLRIQRSVNDLKILINQSEQITRYPEGINEKNIFERLRQLFKAPKSSKSAYDRKILDYGNENGEKRPKIRETFTEDGRSESTLSPSAAGPSASTSHHILVSTTDKIFNHHVTENI